MRRTGSTFFSIALTGIVLAACHQNSAEVSQKDSAENKEGLSISTGLAYGLYDPDTTDAIPAGQYLPNTSKASTVEMVRQALADSLLADELTLLDSSQRKFMFHDIDLNNDGAPETFVALMDDGNTVYLLNDDGTLQSSFSEINLPIVVLRSRTRNWSDLLIGHPGGLYLVKYNRHEYPAQQADWSLYPKAVDPELPKVLDYKTVPYPTFRF